MTTPRSRFMAEPRERRDLPGACGPLGGWLARPLRRLTRHNVEEAACCLLYLAGVVALLFLVG